MLPPVVRPEEKSAHRTTGAKTDRGRNRRCPSGKLLPVHLLRISGSSNAKRQRLGIAYRKRKTGPDTRGCDPPGKPHLFQMPYARHIQMAAGETYHIGRRNASWWGVQMALRGAVRLDRKK